MSELRGPVARPYTDKPLLNLCDIKPGLRVQRWCDGTKLSVETIDSYPFFARQRPDSIVSQINQPNSMWVACLTPYTFSDAGIISLGDMGIAPYDDGHWSPTNYATKAEDLTAVRFPYVERPLDFFQTLEVWLSSVDDSDSPYYNARVVTIMVPDHLQEVVCEHTKTYYTAERCGRRSRPITLTFVHSQ